MSDCRICGRVFKGQIPRAHLNTHGLTGGEYIAQYPQERLNVAGSVAFLGKVKAPHSAQHEIEKAVKNKRRCSK